MDRPAVAIIDVGKTNKKIHIYDRELQLIDTRSRSFEPVEREGVRFESTEELFEWLLDNLSGLAARHNIRVIGTSCHGAAFACVDADGELTVPVVDYTHEPGDSFHDEFYQVAGDRNELQRTTATLELKALINPGKGIYFLKTRFPDEFARTRQILLYDQYFAMRLSGIYVADPTYLACHTYLFDHNSIGYSDVVDRLGIRSLMPKTMSDPGDVLGPILPEIAARTGLSPRTKIIAGIHDSNASLLPYLIKKSDEDLIVNSTGTWCVAMRRADTVAFSEDEIGKAVFYNMSAFREPVKTTILLGGLEFETYTEILKERSGLDSYPDFNPELYRDIVEECSEFILPAVIGGTGQYPDSRARVIDASGTASFADIESGQKTPDLFHDAKRAYAVLNLSLALQTATALRRVGLREAVTVYTEGGFRANRDYNSVLAAICPEAGFFLSGMPEATSFGAALLGWAVVDEVDVHDLGDRFKLEQEPVAPADLPGLQNYAEAFYRHLL